MRKATWIGAAALVIGIPPALAAPDAEEPAPRIETSGDGHTIYYSGGISTAGYQSFQKRLADAPDARELVIASPGGEVLPGRLMASAVNRRHLSVHVEHLCASACALVLMASRDRSIGPAGQIGFHQSRRVKAVKRKSGSDADSKIAGAKRASAPVETHDAFGDDIARRLLVEAGVDAAFIDHALSTTPDDMWYPDAEELLRAHVVTRRADALREDGPSWNVSRAVATGALAGPLWEALALRQPALWARLRDGYWRNVNTGAAAKPSYAAAREEAIDTIMPDVARAPDAIVLRLLDVHAVQARAARADGYLLCDAAYVASPEGAAADAAFAAQEDGVLAELLAVTKWQKPLSEAKAARLVSDNVPQPVEGKSPFDTDDVSDCREGFRVIEAIADRPEKQRARLYRALFTFY